MGNCMPKFKQQRSVLVVRMKDEVFSQTTSSSSSSTSSSSSSTTTTTTTTTTNMSKKILSLQRRRLPPNCTIQETGEMGVIRVKMVMTRREAVRVLAQLAKAGGPHNRPVVERTVSRLLRARMAHSRWMPELESIPEN